MANDVIVTDYDIAGRAANYQDRIFDATALPNATTESSSVFRLAKTQARTEVVIYANTEITILDTQSLTFDLAYDVESGGTFAESKSIASYAASGGNIVIAVGDEIGRYTPDSDVDHYCRIDITASADQSAGKVDANIYRNA